MKNIFALVVAAFIIAAGVYFSAMSWKYVGYVAEDGKFYRLNRITGGLQHCDRSSCIPVTISVNNE